MLVLEANQQVWNTKLSYHKTPLVWDTGASNGLTPFKSDFLDYMEVDIPVKDISKVNRVVGIGTTMYRFVDSVGETIYIPCLSYHLPLAEIRLFSPQTYHQRFGGSSIVHGDGVTMHLNTGEEPPVSVIVPIDPLSNLPVVAKCAVTETEKREIGSYLPSCLSFSDRNFDLFGNWNVNALPCDVDAEYAHYSRIMCPCVADEANVNLSGPQKELLLWHWKLGVSMYQVQELMREQKFEEKTGVETVLPPVIPSKFATASSCPIPKCTACQLASMRKRNPQVVKQLPIPEKEGILSWDKYEPGDFVSSDQFVVKTPGRLLKGYGREGAEHRFHGGTIFNDAASGVIWVEPQVSLGAGETVMSKVRFEEWLWEQAAAEVSHFHSDNGVFADLFREDCKRKGQSQSFSGVGAQHQNARAERAIQTIMYHARTFMIHTSLHWSEYGADDLCLWSFAVKHAAWLYNRLPNRKSGLTPFELLTRTKANHRDLLRTHVWGCPVYVLDPKLQDGKKLPKWNRRSRMGQFLGFSDEHSSLVANFRNLRTGYVSPQYHVVFDDLFQTVHSTGENDVIVDFICQRLFEEERDCYVEEETDRDGNVIYSPPPLHDVWLSEPERRDRKEKLIQQRHRQEECDRIRWIELPPDTSDNNDPAPPLVSDDESSSSDRSSIETMSASGGGGDNDNNDNDNRDGWNDAPEGAPEGAHEEQSTAGDHRIWTRSGGQLQRRTQYACTFGSKQVPPVAQRQHVSRKRLKYRQRMNARRETGDQLLMATAPIDLEVPTVQDLLNSPLAKFVTLAASECGYTGNAKDLIVNWIHPLFLQARSAASKEDYPNYWQAMNGPFAEEYWKAAVKEIETLEGMNAWTVVEREDDMNVIDSTWAFKLKRYPDGMIKKFKARFCARGDQQVEGVDFFDVFAPVVGWTTVRLLLILEVLLDLKSKQGDVTAAFLHADLPDNENVYVEMPRGFRQKGKNGKHKVLKLNKTLYGLRQSPRLFWKYMVQKMEMCGMQQSNLDPCLFIGE
eukprot:g8665.t1 g8665   contig3:647373-650417(+)